MWWVNFLKLGSHVQARDSQELKVASRDLLSTMVYVVVDVLHSEMERLPFEAVIGADQLYPIEEHESHLPRKFSLP